MLLKAAGCIVSYWFEQMNYTYKKIWLIAFPVMMSILIEQLINITDALFLGHVGDVELGASALAGIWFLAIYMLGFGFSLGLQVVIARRNGEQQYAETGKTFFQGLFFLLILAVLLCLLSKIFSPVLLKHLITSDDVYNAVIRYLDWRIWGLLFSFPFLALRSFLVGITQTKALNMAAFTAVLMNIPMNWLLIFGLDMGISGVAIASSFAEMCSLAVLAAYMFRHIDKKAYGLYWHIDITIIERGIFYLGMEYAPVLYKCSHLVSVLRGYRTFGRNRIGCIEHCKKCFRTVFRYRQCVGWCHRFFGE